MNNEPYFIDDDENGMGRCLVLTAQWSDNIVSVIEKENISVLRLSTSAGWEGNNISFIKKIPNIRGIEIYAWDIKDLIPLEDTKNIEYLGIQCQFTKYPDFSNFKNLKKLKIFWTPKANSILSCLWLKSLNIVNYPFQNLYNIKEISGLETLKLTSRKLSSLHGIENFKDLYNLDLFECPMLESISGINNCKNIIILEFEKCKKIYDISPIGELTYLKELTISDCGKINSLHDIFNCQLLEVINFIGDTNIEDGNLEPILYLRKLKKIWFADRRHYSHKRNQIIEMIS